MAWWDFFKVFQYAFTDDPLTQTNRKSNGAGVRQPEVIRNAADGYNTNTSSGSIQLRDTKEFIDLSTVVNRTHRYKEYDRLRSMPEIDSVMTIISDETCFSGDTKVMTPNGAKTLKWLHENEKGDFLVYAYDFKKRDYTLAWAYDPRKTKTAPTVKVMLDDGNYFICTPDHLILLKNEEWIEAGKLQKGHELMPFYRIDANPELTGLKTKQFPRIYTHQKGWINERQFVDEWRIGKSIEEMEPINQYCRMIAGGLSIREINKLTGNDFHTIKDRLKRHGFSNKELKWLGNKPQQKRVLAVVPHKAIDVYDISVREHQNFATEWGIAHNCQRDDEGRVFKIQVQNETIKEELEYLLFHKKMLNLDQKKMWNFAKQTYIFGDLFLEVLINPDQPSDGVLDLLPLPQNSMFRIETTKGRLVEFQQCEDGPDYQSLSRVDIEYASETELQTSKAIRFSPHQIIHIRIGEERSTFYPYGISLIEPARGPAHQLRLMEDAMVVYRLTRAPERRVFYIDIGSVPPAKSEAFVERMKDQFKKKKVPGRGVSGASAVEERWHAPAADEDYWIPTRPNSNTRIETLPGAQNLGEIDDAIYFRDKLYTALNFPKSYFTDDVQSTRIALSARDVTFARLIERLQSYFEDAIWEICDRHLKLQGFPECEYEDLVIKMTPPSDHRETTRQEVISNRVNIASTIKSAGLLSDYDNLIYSMKFSEEEAKAYVARVKEQKIEELKLQIIATNPTILGVGIPGPNDVEVGTEPGGPNPNLDPNIPPDPSQTMGSGQLPAPNMIQQMPGAEGGLAPPVSGMKKYMDSETQDQGGIPNKVSTPIKGSGNILPDADLDDIRRFDLEIKDFDKEIDEEEYEF